MKTALVLLAILMLCVSKTIAQNESKKFSVGFGIEAGVPSGPPSDLYSFAVGLTVRFSYHVGPGFVTLTGGALGYDPKSIAGQPKKVGLQIPVKAGYKYIIQHHFFVMGEVGYAEFKTYYGSNGELLSINHGSAIAAPSIGVQFNAFEVAIRYEANFSNGGGGLFGARIGFNF